MNRTVASPTSMGRSPLVQLILARLREFYREPEALFWVYGFPLLMTIALGIAFRNKSIDQIPIDIQEDPATQTVAAELGSDERFVVQIHDAATCRPRLRFGKTEVVVAPSPIAGETYQFWIVSSRAESVAARGAVDDTLQTRAGRIDPLVNSTEVLDEAGGRYIDFLIPGLLGMSLMGGGLWGVGFVTVDMRIRKLLKRFLATPMKKSQFLAALMLSRLIFLVPEVLVLLVFAWLAFGVVIRGSLVSVILLILLGALTFAGIGLLVASRARTLEAVSGLMNLVMLPMWILSGIFFSSERFPQVAQPLIKLIPLTPLIDALRSVMLEGASFMSQLPEIGILVVWGSLTFLLALRWFRWT
jgi:ABC-type multidrug transport system permease subunit